MAAQLAVTGLRPNEAPPRRSATEGGRRISSAAFFVQSEAAAAPAATLPKGRTASPGKQNGPKKPFTLRKRPNGTIGGDNPHMDIFALISNRFRYIRKIFRKKIDLFRSPASGQGTKQCNILSNKQYESAERRKGPRSAPGTHAEYQRNIHRSIQFGPHTIP